MTHNKKEIKTSGHIIRTTIATHKGGSCEEGGSLIESQTKKNLEKNNYSKIQNTPKRKTHTKEAKRRLTRTLHHGNSAMLKHKSLILVALISILIFGRVSCQTTDQTQQIKDAIQEKMQTVKEELLAKLITEIKKSLTEQLDQKAQEIEIELQNSADESNLPTSSFLKLKYDVFVKHICYVTDYKYESISHNMDRGAPTHRNSLTFKNKDTWVATKQNIGLTLFKDGVLVYDKPLPHGSDLRDSVYVNDYFYLAAYDQRLIYKKSIDAHEPVVWVKDILMNDWAAEKSLAASPTQNALLVNQALTNIIAISLADSTKRFTIFTGKEIRSHSVFGAKKNLVAICTHGGAFFIYRFSMKKMKSWLIASLQLPLIGARAETTPTIAIDETNKYIAVASRRNAHDHRSSRMFILEFNQSEKQLVIKNEIDLWDSGLNVFHSLEFYGYYGNHLLLTGIDYYWNNFAVFDYNTKYGHFEEIRRMRRKVDVAWSWSLHKIGGELRSVSHNGKLTTIKLSEFQ